MDPSSDVTPLHAGAASPAAGPAAAPFDVAVRGTGAVGCSLALALARQGLRVVLLGALPAPDRADVRAYALNAASIALLERLGAWQRLPADAATAVDDMHVVGDRPGASIDFSASQQHVRTLAWIVDAGALEAALGACVRDTPSIVCREASAPGDEAPQAALQVLAEGKDSATRRALGVEFDRHAYGHTAIAARLVADRPHAGCARQWFRSPDVLALLPFDIPMPRHGYGLVWSMPDAQAASLMAATDDAFETALNEATAGEAGRLRLASVRATWPLMLARADRWVGPGWALVGDAAHVVHPLAGQGLNLGLADVEALASVIAEREPWRGLGDERLLRRYVARRDLATRSMAGLTDGLLQLFGSPAPLLRELRNRGLGLVDRMTPLKRWLTARALGLGG